MCPIEGPNGATMTRATTIIERGTAARRLVESVDKRRRERADRIDVISATERGGRLIATVRSEDKVKTYKTVISLDVRGKRGWVRCDCDDNRRRNLPCKHSVAVANRYRAAKREELLRLRGDAVTEHTEGI